jgi:hypothetical protein
VIDGFGNIPAFALYQRLSKSDTSKQVAQFAQTPAVKKEIEYFRQQAAKVKTVDEFLNDPRMLKFALSAYSLEGEMQFPGRIKKVMVGDPKDPKALANRLADPRFREINKDFALGQTGTANLKLAKFVDGIVSKYLTNEYEKKLGEQNPALREVAYFKRKIGEVKDVYGILGDKVLRSVVMEALRIPPEVANQSVEKQAELVSKGFKMDKAKDPAYVEQFLKRFMVMRDRAAMDEGGGAMSVDQLNGNAALAMLQGAGRLNILV